jgi:hypothetical protein
LPCLKQLLAKPYREPPYCTPWISCVRLNTRIKINLRKQLRIKETGSKPTRDKEKKKEKGNTRRV